MNTVLHRFLAPLTSGVRVTLAVLAGCYLLARAGEVTQAYDLSSWLALSGAAFWKGRVWTVVTYALLPAGLLDFLFNTLLIAILGPFVERAWSRGEFWSYCLIVTFCAGALKAGLQPSSPMLLKGAGPLAFGLLAAWGWLYAHEPVLLFGVWKTTARQAAILLTVVGFLLMWYTCCLFNAVLLLCGAVAGWLYLLARNRMNLARQSRGTTSQRMGRLEL